MTQTTKTVEVRLHSWTRLCDAGYFLAQVTQGRALFWVGTTPPKARAHTGFLCNEEDSFVGTYTAPVWAKSSTPTATLVVLGEQ